MLTNDKHLFVVLIVLPLTFFILHNAQPFAMIVEYSNDTSQQHSLQSQSIISASVFNSWYRMFFKVKLKCNNSYARLSNALSQ